MLTFVVFFFFLYIYILIIHPFFLSHWVVFTSYCIELRPMAYIISQLLFGLCVGLPIQSLCFLQCLSLITLESLYFFPFFFSNTFLIYILPQPSFVSLWENYLILWNYRAAADALSKRHSDGSLPLENFNIELEDQSGQKVRLGSENDQRYDFRNTVFSLSVWILLVGFY